MCKKQRLVLDDRLTLWSNESHDILHPRVVQYTLYNMKSSIFLASNEVQWFNTINHENPERRYTFLRRTNEVQRCSFIKLKTPQLFLPSFFQSIVRVPNFFFFLQYLLILRFSRSNRLITSPRASCTFISDEINYLDFDVEYLRKVILVLVTILKFFKL